MVKHERLRRVAMSMAKADSEKHHGHPYKLFRDVHEKVVERALQLREHENTEGWLMDYPQEISYNGLEAGRGLSIIFDRIRKVNDGSDGAPVQGGGESRWHECCRGTA